MKEDTGRQERLEKIPKKGLINVVLGLQEKVEELEKRLEFFINDWNER